MAYSIILPRVAEERCPIASQMVALIKGSQRQQTGIAGHLAIREVSQNGLIAVEGEAQLWYTRCHVWDAPKRCTGFSENPMFMHFFEHPCSRNSQEAR